MAPARTPKAAVERALSATRQSPRQQPSGIPNTLTKKYAAKSTSPAILAYEFYAGGRSDGMVGASPVPGNLPGVCGGRRLGLRPRREAPLHRELPALRRLRGLRIPGGRV